MAMISIPPKSAALLRAAPSYPSPSPSPSTSCPASPPAASSFLSSKNSVPMNVCDADRLSAFRLPAPQLSADCLSAVLKQSQLSVDHFRSSPAFAAFVPRVVSTNNRRKCHAPHKSIPNNAERTASSGIVKLDVYSVYLKCPKRLIYPYKKKINTESLRRTSTRTSKPAAPARSQAPRPSSNSNQQHEIVEHELQDYVPINVERRHYVKHEPSIDGFIKNSAPTSGDIAAEICDASGDYKGYDPDYRICNDDYKDTKGAQLVAWKGLALDISPNCERYHDLTPEELHSCRILRVFPHQYLHIKEVLVSAVVVRGPYKKRDAQGWFRMDVNKTNKLYDWFKTLGWIPNSPEEWPALARRMIARNRARALAQARKQYAA